MEGTGDAEMRGELAAEPEAAALEPVWIPFSHGDATEAALSAVPVRGAEARRGAERRSAGTGSGSAAPGDEAPATIEGGHAAEAGGRDAAEADAHLPGLGQAEDGEPAPEAGGHLPGSGRAGDAALEADGGQSAPGQLEDVVSGEADAQLPGAVRAEDLASGEADAVESQATAANGHLPGPGDGAVADEVRAAEAGLSSADRAEDLESGEADAQPPETEAQLPGGDRAEDPAHGEADAVASQATAANGHLPGPGDGAAADGVRKADATELEADASSRLEDPASRGPQPAAGDHLPSLGQAEPGAASDGDGPEREVKPEGRTEGAREASTDDAVAAVTAAGNGHGTGTAPGPAAGGGAEPEVTSQPSGPEAPAADDSATPADGVAASQGEPVPLSVVAQRLAISPYTLRSLLDEFADIVPVTRGAAGGQPALATEAFDRLRFIAAAHAQGLAHEEVRHRLEGVGDATAPADVLLDRLEQLQAELAQSERRRVEDRDRLLMALMRTQQEIQHLRVEMTGTRRSRRKGFWARLFGR